MPLVWAHAEYLKLLRSVTDGKVFDRISAVAERYCHGKRPAPVEVFRLNRQRHSMVAGKKLRMLADDRFFLVWTLDDWTTVRNDGEPRSGLCRAFRRHGNRAGQSRPA